MKKLLLSITLVIALTSSVYGAVTVNLYNETTKYEKTDPATIKVFRQQPEGREFIKIGEILVEGASNWKDAERKIVKQSAEIGADAAYVIDITYINRNPSSRKGVLGAMLNDQETVTAVAIKYKDSAKP